MRDKGQAERASPSRPLFWLVAGCPTILRLNLVVFALALFGCDRATMIKKMIPERDADVAKHYLDAIRHGDYNTVERDADDSMAGPDLRQNLIRLTAMFPIPSEEPKSVKPVALGLYKRPNTPVNTSVTLEYEFSEEWVLAAVTTQKVEGALKITRIDIKPIPEALEIVNAFTFRNMSWTRYEVLVLALAAPLVTLCALVFCIRNPPGKSKWIWLAFIQVAVGNLTVNWTTGEMSLTAFALQMIMPSGVYALGFGPWTVYTSLPIGAIAFLFHRASKGAPLHPQPSHSSGNRRIRPWID